jgi:hypothetical protein
MVGGKVIGVVRGPDTLLNVKGTGCEENDTCAVRCLEVVAITTVVKIPREYPTGTKIQIEVGDGVWWQSGYLFWTPADKHVQDVPLPRKGYSH